MENQCFDVATDAANSSKNRDVSSGHVDDEEDEEGDVDFNPFLKDAPSLEASSSLSSEIEEFDADVVDSGERHPPVDNTVNAPDDAHGDAVGNVERGRETMVPAAESSAEACRDKEIEPNIVTNTVTNVTVPVDDINDEDAIWRRTRARYSLVGSTLDELETFLQETDDEDDLHNIDDEEEYRKFLAAVLQGGDGSLGGAQESDNVDDEEDEDNDADFELEIEEALGSDDENLQFVSREEEEHAQVGRRRPETRQKKRQKTDHPPKKFSAQTNRPLRPILPYAPIALPSDPNARSYMIPTNTSGYVSSLGKTNYVSAFTPHQIGQLHCLIYEHVQLLVQVFSLSVLEPSRQHVATQVQRLLSEMLHKHDQVLASQRVPYPSFCFNLPYIRSASTPHCDPNSYQNGSNGSTGHGQPTEGVFWEPFVSDTVLSVIDVAPLNLVQSYMDDVSTAVQEHQQRQLEVSYDAAADKECLFPFKSLNSSAESTSGDSTLLPSKGSDQKSKKTIAAALVERSKKQSIALVPKEIAKLARRFFLLFNPALFPHKPPPASVANRVLFTDSEDGLLALGLMKYNTNWKEIQKNYLPCKSAHQIFVRQKNRSCSRAPENPIKAVRRMKTSPLTPQEKARIEEGLKVYKLDWMAVWKYMVPHRDPLLLARQWRTAVGNQKSYKGDELTKAKRRLYESKRRKSKLESSRLQATSAGQNREGWSTEEDVRYKDKELQNSSTDNPGGENNSGDDGGNNDDEAYVHEAFLADWRPGPSSEFAVSNLRENDTGPVNFHTPHPNVSSYLVPAKIFRSSEPEPRIRPYRAPRSDCSRLVKLAPDLPPVNLPPTVRIMSQSAFTKYRDEASSKARENVGPAIPLSHPRIVQLDDRSPLRCSTSDPVEKGDSDLQMHPLLFQDPEDGSLPYYPLNGSAGSSSSFDFFPNNPPQLNLNLFRYSHQAKNTLNFFNNPLKSKELASSLSGVDFHPLLQRTDDGNGHPGSAPMVPPLPGASPTAHRKSSSTGVNTIPRSPNELDLDIRLSSSTARKDKGRNGHEFGTAEPQASGSRNREKGLLDEMGNDPDSGSRSVGIENDEIVMEQEELSDSEEDDEIAESVEFECEEMTDTEGEDGSDSDHVEDVRNEGK